MAVRSCAAGRCASVVVKTEDHEGGGRGIRAFR